MVISNMDHMYTCNNVRLEMERQSISFTYEGSVLQIRGQVEMETTNSGGPVDDGCGCAVVKRGNLSVLCFVPNHRQE